MPVWFQTTQIARPQYYDRNAVGIFAAFEGLLTTHGATTRWQYVVPVNRSTYIESLYAYQVRQVASGAPVYNECLVSYVPGGGGSGKIFDLPFNNNVPFNSVYTNNTSFGYIRAGDTINGQTQMSDPSGNITFGIAFKGTEFDK